MDARACLHCGTLSYAHHTQAIMQSSFKAPHPSFIEEINRDLKASAMEADHVIFMGYSLPLDDVLYRTFFAVRRQNFSHQGGRAVRCTIIGRDDENPGWRGPEDLKNSENATVQAAKDIFGEDNVRFHGGGVPGVFVDSAGQATAEKLEQLLDWSSTV